MQPAPMTMISFRVISHPSLSASLYLMTWIKPPILAFLKPAASVPTGFLVSSLAMCQVGPLVALQDRVTVQHPGQVFTTFAGLPLRPLAEQLHARIRVNIARFTRFRSNPVKFLLAYE